MPGNRRTYVDFPEAGRVQVVQATDAHFIYKEIFDDREYLRHGINLQRGDVVFDVGANIGLFSIFAYQACGGDVTIHAFEPVGPVFAALELNLATHTGGLETVHAHNMGLTSLGGPGRAAITYYDRQPGNSTMKPAEKQDQIEKQVLSARPAVPPLGPWRGGVRSLSAQVRSGWVRWRIRQSYRGTPVLCQFVSLSAFLRTADVGRIDLVKIDVEGAEWDVVRGIEDRDWDRIRQVVMEAHDIDGRVDRIAQLLGEQGFRHLVVEKPDFAESRELDNTNIYARR